MKRFVIASLATSLVALVACQAPWSEDTDNSDSDLDQALVCQNPPVAKSYVGFDNAKLEDKRLNESLDANKARFKPFSVMAGEYQRVLGTVPKSLTSAGETFSDPPARWYTEPTHSGVSLSSAFTIALEGCSTMVSGQADKAKAPAADTASTFCKDLMTKAYDADPTPDQVTTCSTLATQKLTSITDAKGKWAHVCASILTSSQFLTY